MEGYSEYPESKAIWVKKTKNLVASIVKHSSLEHFCGYIRFPYRFLEEVGYNGILTYVPVHGGITYAEESGDGSIVYGFDCAHSGDWSSSHPKGHEWTEAEVVREISNMALGILTAWKFERKYLYSDFRTWFERNILRKDVSESERKAKVVDKYHKELERKNVRFNLQDNFGAMINVLAGEI